MAYHLTSLTIPYARDGHSRARAYEGIARAGFSHVGLYDGHEEGPVWPVGITASQARIAVQPALDAGLAIDHKSHGQVTDNPELFTQAIEFASEACVPSLVCWGPYEYESGTFPAVAKKPDVWQSELNGFFTAFEAGVREAETAGVLLLPKPHTGVGKHGAALRELHDRFESSAVGVCYDTGNVHYYEGLDPITDVVPVAGLCQQLIIKDHVGPQGNPVFRTPGDGDLDHQAVLAILAESGFRGSLVNERLDVSGLESIDAELVRAHRHISAIANATLANHSNG